MNISFTLDQQEVIDSNDPVGNMTITDGKTILTVESTYLDSWFDVLIDGLQGLNKKDKLTLEIVEEPEMIIFENTLPGLKITYGKEELFFKKNYFYQELLNSVREFLFQLNQNEKDLTSLPIVRKLRNFIEQSSIKQDQKPKALT
ncbi:hypothetical protein VB711_24250 [Cronbergia sp. UHCC 0137]|uniref:hypothetical protein n=1 Tax=Cronbergia sp. UHCC 0137 TaxID=3110239 RepID=UPI002B1FF7E7|nr:hypothetical protein [Cronbergia sp. UHCC 0137]MEA5620925.1 hypothetical protein [Cronbergia sp. UHCC 0137]